VCDGGSTTILRFVPADWRVMLFAAVGGALAVAAAGDGAAAGTLRAWVALVRGPGMAGCVVCGTAGGWDREGK